MLVHESVCFLDFQLISLKEFIFFIGTCSGTDSSMIKSRMSFTVKFYSTVGEVH